jgi:hydroxymethylpyrimidine kinase / phosphomethylpyrimidine kinase / thiamine-phosphate diphosphorylase
LESQIITAIALGRKYQARLFINDYWQLAIEHQAYGVHLGQEDLDVADLDAIRNAGLRLGLSTHGYYEMLRAHAYRPSYIAMGAIYATTTKDMPSKPQGLKKLKDYVRLMGGHYPLVAIGGISSARAHDVWQQGAGSIALVTAVTKADNYQNAVKELMSITEESYVEH